MTEQRGGCARTEEAVGWALHALEPNEELAVEHHIPTCPDCQAAVYDTDVVMTHLASAVEMVDPPARLRDAILREVAVTPQVPPQRLFPPTASELAAAGRPTTSVPVPRRPTNAPPAATGPSGPSRQRGSRPRRLVAAAAALATVVVVGGLGLRTVQLQEQVDVAASQAGSTTELVRRLAQPGVAHALLARPDGTAVAAVVLTNGQRDVYTLGLTSNATDHTYVLWGLKDKTSAPQPLGAFDVATQDAGRRVVGPSGGDAFAAYAISLEPGRTPPTSPTDVVAAGNLRT